MIQRNEQMNRQPLFSVVTASLNAGETIRNTLESVRGQREVPVEHIVCDGGSTDNTTIILEEFCGTYNLRWISEPDNGIAEALNKGVFQSTGKYILVLQADDAFLRPETLSLVSVFIKKSYKDIYSFPVILDHPTLGRKLRRPIRHLWYNRFKFIFLHQGCFVNRRVFNDVGGFNSSFKIAMDYDFFYRALKHNCSVSFQSQPVSLMGGTGVGTILEAVSLRLTEERQVQEINEANCFWRAFQKLFWFMYLPYKNLWVKKYIPNFSIHTLIF
jgi:glycosyltransferase involved in cell wall biosynthesis